MADLARPIAWASGFYRPKPLRLVRVRLHRPIRHGGATLGRHVSGDAILDVAAASEVGKMSVAFIKGQVLGRDDLNLFVANASGHPTNAAEISYALIDFTTGQEVVVGPAQRSPVNPSVGEYFASILIPKDANSGDYRIRWTMKEIIGGPIQTVVQEFHVRDAEAPMVLPFSLAQSDMVRRLRMLLRDQNPDKFYKFRPPAHEETVDQFSRVFGYIWEDEELLEYLNRSLDMIAASPPRTPFNDIDQMIAFRPEWRTLLITGAMIYALQALQINWVADEFDYSIGGVSLSVEKSSKYESLKQGASDQFDKQLEKAKSTVKFIKGLQQPKFGVGIRSSFGPYVGRGVLAPRNFLGV